MGLLIKVPYTSRCTRDNLNGSLWINITSQRVVYLESADALSSEHLSATGGRLFVMVNTEHVLINNNIIDIDHSISYRKT